MEGFVKPATRIIDAHTHIFPHKIAQKATDAIGAFYDIPMDSVGESQALLASGRKIGVDLYLVCSSATTPAQTQHINDFIAQECTLHNEFFGFGTLHPEMENLEAEAVRIAALQLHGIKLHPDFQKFDIDDPKAINMYRICAQYDLPVLFHTGDDRYEFSSPEKLARALDAAPGMTAIAAHFGGYRRWQDAAKYLMGRENVWFDTSSTLFALPKDDALEILNALGYERFFFGTDHPMWDHESELKRFLSLGLPQNMTDAIFYQNFERAFAAQLSDR